MARLRQVNQNQSSRYLFCFSLPVQELRLPIAHENLGAREFVLEDF